MQLRDYFTEEMRSEADRTSSNKIGTTVDASKQARPLGSRLCPSKLWEEAGGIQRSREGENVL